VNVDTCGKVNRKLKMNEIWKKLLKKHKKALSTAFSQGNRDSIGNIEKTGKELSLVYADFKCQNPKCKSEEKLTYHHLILRKTKEFMDFWRYASARYYWSNIVILCQKCHHAVHKINGKENETETIEQTHVEKLKKKYSPRICRGNPSS